jgi:hypothetical protein
MEEVEVQVVVRVQLMVHPVQELADMVTLVVEKHQMDHMRVEVEVALEQLDQQLRMILAEQVDQELLLLSLEL